MAHPLIKCKITARPRAACRFLKSWQPVRGLPVGVLINYYYYLRSSGHPAVSPFSENDRLAHHQAKKHEREQRRRARRAAEAAAGPEAAAAAAEADVDVRGPAIP